MRATTGQLAPRFLSWVFDSMLCRVDQPARPATQTDGTSSSLATNEASWSPTRSASPATVYLTFDDGPSLATRDLVSLLGQYRVPAGFFVTGENVRKYPQLVHELAEAGHELGNHTDHHRDAWRISRRQQLRELSGGARALKQVLGRPVTWMRPPYGHFTWPMIVWCRRARQRMVMWDLLPPDYELDCTVDRLEAWWWRYLRPGSIVCLHDQLGCRHRTLQLLERVLPAMQSAGWTFARLPEVEQLAPSWRKDPHFRTVAEPRGRCETLGHREPALS